MSSSSSSDTTTHAFVVGKVPVPTEEERAALARVVSERSEVRSIFLLDNRRTSADGPVEGAVYEFAHEARIRDGSPLVAAADRLFGHVLVARVLNDALDEAQIKRRLPSVAEQLHTVSPQPYVLSQNVGPNADIYDAASWVAQLGGHGHFVGIYKEEGDRTVPKYSVVVHTDSGHVGRELVDKFVLPRLGQLSYGALYKSPEYKRAELQSRRNAQRLLALAAELFGVRILKSDDHWARLEQFDAPPDLGVADLSATEYNMLRVLPRHSHEAVVFYSRSSHLCSVTTPTVAYLVDPCYGLVLYKRDPGRHHVANGVWSNNACSGFPIATGRLMSSAAVADKRKAAARQRDLQQFVNMIVHWQGRAETVAPYTHERIHAYADYTDEQQTVHISQLGAKFGHTRLKPVCVIVPPPPSPGVAST